MSLNTLDKNTYGTRKPPLQGDSRSLRTDDIEGAKPKSGLRRQTDQGVYSGLNLPSYATSTNPRQPLRAQNVSSDISKNIANFFGISPPGSPKVQNYKNPSDGDLFPRNQDYQVENPGLNPKDAANFYGVTPPRSRAADPYGKKEGVEGESNPAGLPQKDLANFYGVTPPISRSGQNPQDYLGNYARPPRAEARNSFDQGNVYSVNPSVPGVPAVPAVPAKVAAGFYGATPPASRAAGLSQKDLANFYGVTPPPTGKPGLYEEAPNTRAVYNPKYDMNYVPNRPDEFEAPRNPDPRMIPSKEMANFYGVTPPPSGKPAGYSSDHQVNNRNLANFYGVTPPPTGNKGFLSNPQGSGPGPSGKDFANFYGVTPPPTGKQGNLYYSNENPYQNLPGSYANSGNYPDYYANPAGRNEALDPEFQYAADLAQKANPGKVPEGPASRGYNQVSTASRIFN